MLLYLIYFTIPTKPTYIIHNVDYLDGVDVEYILCSAAVIKRYYNMRNLLFYVIIFYFIPKYYILFWRYNIPRLYKYLFKIIQNENIIFLPEKCSFIYSFYGVKCVYRICSSLGFWQNNVRRGIRCRHCDIRSGRRKSLILREV